jgi:phytoene dehydrogenase-like protein/ferredoxin-NADP reductase
MAQAWDAIVIGSGIGGLSAAGFLAKIGGLRVLVLEKHRERGGLTHVFRRDGASWDVGVHYIGELQPGETIRALFDLLSGGALHWNPMPDDFERFVYPGLDFAVPSDPQRYRERLIARFPEEADAIRAYFADLESVANWHVRAILEPALPAPLALLLAQWRRLGAAKATQTTQAYCDRRFKSPELKALLTTQWGDCGLPPRESAFAVHALVARSYLRGAWFPEGGAGRIARTIEAGIEAGGGAIKVAHEATRILVENGRAVGVAALDRRGADPVEVEFRAPVVISNVGASVTYEKLLPTDGEIGARTARQRAEIAALAGGASAVTLYLRLDRPVSTLGVGGENSWINTTFEHGDLDGETAAVLAGRPRHAFMSFPSAKSGDSRFHTAEILALVQPEAFAPWRGTTHGQRGADYEDLKKRIGQGLLDLAETVTPGLGALVRYAEVSTPLSVEDFISSPCGRIYGLRASPERYRARSFAYSPIEGLHLSGCDAACLGISGALMGGVCAAAQVLGPFGLGRIMAAAHRAPRAKTGKPARSPEKQAARLVAKAALSPAIWRLEFELDAPIRFVPGQHVKLRVAPFEWRDYSIAAARDRRLTLLVSARTGGDGSLFAQNAQAGAQTEVELPFGAYRLRPNAARRIFVATGAGLAPFLPMFEALAASGELETAELFFGCLTARDDITRFFQPLPRATVCIDGDPGAENAFHGRVTAALAKLAFDPATTDFYLCGSAAMVADCHATLARAGATRILTEPF